MMTPEPLWLDSCGSTNTELAAMPDAPHGFVVATREQTAWRWQRGNTWEAQPGANLTFSLLLRPGGIPAARQFEMSMLVSLGIADALDGLLAESGCAERIAIKWPNDIYIGDRKLCGILIENSLAGSAIGRAIAGIGINVNQRRFLSDAPNPVSLVEFTGRELPLEETLEKVVGAIVGEIDRYGSDGDGEALTGRYMARLWRRDGQWPFREQGGAVFTASIEAVAPDGTLTLSNGRSYAFKEVAFVL